jgi:hypothetical protein
MMSLLLENAQFVDCTNYQTVIVLASKTTLGQFNNQIRRPEITKILPRILL